MSGLTKQGKENTNLCWHLAAAKISSSRKEQKEPQIDIAWIAHYNLRSSLWSP